MAILSSRGDWLKVRKSIQWTDFFTFCSLASCLPVSENGQVAYVNFNSDLTSLQTKCTDTLFHFWPFISFRKKWVGRYHWILLVNVPFFSRQTSFLFFYFLKSQVKYCGVCGPALHKICPQTQIYLLFQLPKGSSNSIPYQRGNTKFINSTVVAGTTLLHCYYIKGVMLI